VEEAVVGNGNASKEAVLAHAMSCGYTGERQDPADALAIAEYGCQLLGRKPPRRRGVGAQLPLAA
jgi:Holliday junction resolvasome RuvABC endonuclease subunit